MKRLVVLGAGYAGIQAVRAAAGAGGDHEITLVDQNGYHQLVTEMYRVVGGSVDPERLVLPVERLIDPRRVRFLKGTVEALEPPKRQVSVDGRSIAYDACVLALGSEPEFFDIPGARRHSFTLQYLDSARRLRRRLAELTTDPGRKRTLHIVIVGGGLTGVELSAEIAEYLRTKARGTATSMVLLQAAPSILPDEPEDLVHYADAALAGLRISVRPGAAVKEVRGRDVLLEDGTCLPSELTIWTGGIRANPVGARAGLLADRRDRIQVDANLRCEGVRDLFAAGDCALASDRSTGRPLPPTAQLAVAEGRIAGRNAAALLEGIPLKAFRPRPLAVAASLGWTRGIANLKRLHLFGRSGLTVKKLALWRYLINLEGLAMGFSETPFPLWGGARETGANPSAEPTRSGRLAP